MTVVSIVFAIVLMTLTLTSTQFSPRILTNFIRYRITQWTLGIFLGTFAYCVAALPAARSLPSPFVPVAAVTGAMLLVLLCVGWLICFINHVSKSINVNYMVDRIGREIVHVIDEVMPEARGVSFVAERQELRDTKDLVPILSRQSGYIRYIDINLLIELAQAYRVCVHVERRVGQFVPAGVPLLRVSKPERVPPDYGLHLVGAFDIGPTRTLQQDVEFGIIQISDIALRALSPAINDPSTAISCINQLSQIMIVWMSRKQPPSRYYRPSDVLRVVVPWVTFEDLLDTGFEQIRYYATSDAPVSLRLIRAFTDMVGTTEDPNLRSILADRAGRVAAGCAQLPKEQFAKIKQRLARLAPQTLEGSSTA